MNTRFRLGLNGLGLCDIDESIIITDIVEATPKIKNLTAANGGGDGLRLSRTVRESLAVTVRFLIREYDAARRKHLCSQVCAWAAEGGWLTLSDRPGQKLRVVCTALPAVTSSLRWTEPLILSFTALAQPYWQDEQPALVQLSLAQAGKAEGVLRPGGTAPRAPMEAAFTAGDSPVTALTITAGETFLTLEDPALIPSGETLVIGYDEHGLLTIRAGSESRLVARTPQSSDDLLLVPGRPNAVTITADAPLQAKLMARGLYL